MDKEEKKIFLEISPQYMVNILEALTIYQDVALSEKYKYIVEDLFNIINEQLQFQGINIYTNSKKQHNLIGKFCQVNDLNINDLSISTIQGVIIGVSDIDGLIKVLISNNNKLEILDVPLNSISNIDIKNEGV